jgi:hypothetical protein
MSEKPPRTPESPQFEKGGLVRLREGVSSEMTEALRGIMEPGMTYKIFFVSHNDDPGGDSIWIGPSDALPSDVDAFDPKIFSGEDEGLIVRYKNIFPVSGNHLRLLLN